MIEFAGRESIAVPPDLARAATQLATDLRAIVLVVGSGRWSFGGARTAIERAASHFDFDVVTVGLGPGELCAAVGIRRARPLKRTQVQGFGAHAHALAAQSLGEPPWLAIGGFLPGQTGVEYSYREAIEAFRIARMKHRDPVWTLYEDVILEATIVSSSHAARLAAVLDPIAAYRRNMPLVETLRTYFAEQFEIQRVAARLRVHRHTVTYRLRIIEKLLGRSLRSVPDRLILEAALLARDLTPKT